MKIYGPYKRKDGRMHLVIRDNGKLTTLSYPRYLMEQHLNRKLLPEETVDHINHDFTDNRLENLQILSLRDNVLKEIRREHRRRKYYTFCCPTCGNVSVKALNHVQANWKKGKQGPYCSRSCAGKATYKNPW